MSRRRWTWIVVTVVLLVALVLGLGLLLERPISPMVFHYTSPAVTSSP
jgi:hypothetical protein